MKKMLISSLIVLTFVSCGQKKRNIDINKIKSTIVSVKSGNTVELTNGLTVELLGVEPTENGRKYLEEYAKGKSVSLRCDSKQGKKSIKTYMTTVRAYVKIAGEPISLNGKLLLSRKASLNQNRLHDSLNVYKRYVNPDRRPILTDSELLTIMKPATFMIFTREGESLACGTGFFINDSGLALTNHHVFNHDTSNAVICFFGEDGVLNTSNRKHISHILFSYRGEGELSKIDFTVFQVQMNGNEKVSYLPLVRNHINDGERIAKIGCPAGTVCNFQTGNLSNYNQGYLTHSISCNQGDSGGPVVNFRGEVVGVNQSIEFNQALSAMTGSVQKAEGIAYAVDAVLIREVLDANGIEYGQ